MPLLRAQTVRKSASNTSVVQGASISELIDAGAPLWVGERCDEGYTGLLCARCRPGYTPWGQYECRQCRGGLAVFTIAVLVTTATVLVSIGLVLNALRQGAQAAETL